jgi:HEAT repeat protein
MFWWELLRLRSKSSETRQHACERLVEVGRARAVSPLIALLTSDSDAGVRYCAARALGELADSRAVEPLICALEDRGGEVAFEAAAALGQIRDGRAVIPLLKLLNLANGRGKAALLDVLGQIGSLRALSAIYSVAMWWEPTSAKATVAAKELAKLESPDSIMRVALAGDELYEKVEAAKRDLQAVVLSGSPVFHNVGGLICTSKNG